MTGDFRRLLVACLAVLVVVLGTAIPVSVFYWFARRYKKGEIADLTWEEGFGFIVWVEWLVPFVLCQVGALVLAIQSWDLLPARAAGVGAIGLLSLAVIYHTWVLWGHFGECWAFIWAFISSWWR